jgi:ATP-dependent Clp protease ATP-binding subunit ClpC
MVDSTDFARVLAEAADIAQSVSQDLTTAHVLLALFTVENRAQLLLKERGIDEDVLLEAMTAAPREEDGLVRELRERTREIARSCGCAEADSLHALIASTRVRCAAQELLLTVGLDLTALRNTAFSYYLSGRMPRKLRLGRVEPFRPAGRRASPAPVAASSVTLAVERSPSESAPATSAGDLVDVADEAVGPRPAPRRSSATSLTAAAPARLALDAAEYPLLASLGRNLSAAAKAGRLDPVVGRGREIDEVIDILGKRRTNNPCLVGEPGVGKTAVVEGVAQRLAEATGASGERIIVELDMATLLAGTQLRGSFSEKLNELKDEVKRAAGRVIVFVDEVHTLVGAGATGEGAQDAANELKSAMSRGEFPCIGATTHDEFRRFIAQDPALERRFTPVAVNEPSVPETVAILQGVIARYEEHHRVRYAPEALHAAASLAARYVSDRFLPDKAISIVDLSGSRARRERRSLVESEDVARTVARLAGIPEERLVLGDRERLLRLEEELKARVVAHEEVASRMARVLRRNYAGFASRRPLGSFLFLGPTGVGKTAMARALAEVLYGTHDALTRIDMSELSEAHGISRLLGAPPGYVGHGEGGQLTEPVRRRPSSVVVLDEIDKAHREVWMLLLQVLDEGRLTDGKGRHIDFSNAVVILTTNLGAEAFDRKTRPLGFGNEARAGAVAAEEAAMHSARRALPPELWNRIDERLVFRPLEEKEIARVAALILAESSERLASEKSIEYVCGDDVVALLLGSAGFDPSVGARPMRQTVQRLVEAPIAEGILKGEFVSGDRIRVVAHGGGLAFRREART